MSAEPQLSAETQLRPVAQRRLTALPAQLLNRLPATQGAFWVLFAIGAPKVLGPIFTIGLRRFLGPGAAGVYDLAVTPYKFLDNFRNFGTGPALVYERTVSRQVVDTAWTINMIMAVIITAIVQVLAGPIAGYYQHPEVEPILRVLSIAYIFLSVIAVHYFLLLRDLDFRARAIPPVGQVIVAGDLAVLFAVWGFGVGALVAREVGSAIAGAILLWAVYPYRPRISLVPSIAWRLFRYGAWVGAGLTVLYMSQNVDVFIGGHVIHKTSDIGFYTTSWKIAFIAASVFTLVASSMVFPALSRVKDDIELLRRKLLVSIRQLGLVMFPAAAIVAATAPVFIVPVLGEKYAAYRSSFLVLSLLAVYAGNRTMLSIFFEGYKSIGKPWIVPIYNAIKLAIMVPAMIYGAQHGILGLALTYIPIQLLEIPIGVYLARAVLRISIGAIWRAASVPVIATLVMSAAVVAAEYGLHHGANLGDTLTLIACLVVGAVVYVAVVALMDRSIIREGLGVLARGL